MVKIICDKCNKCKKRIPDKYPREHFVCDYCKKSFCNTSDLKCSVKNYFVVYYFDMHLGSDEFSDNVKSRVCCGDCFYNH